MQNFCSNCGHEFSLKEKWVTGKCAECGKKSAEAEQTVTVTLKNVQVGGSITITQNGKTTRIDPRDLR